MEEWCHGFHDEYYFSHIDLYIKFLYMGNKLFVKAWRIGGTENNLKPRGEEKFLDIRYILDSEY